MTRSSKPKNATVWVFLLLLAYIGQMLGVGAHASVMMGAPKEAPAMSSSCHGEGPHGEGHHGMMHQVNELESAVHTDEMGDGSRSSLMSCCADNCSMLSCFSVSVILESFDTRKFTLSSSNNFFVNHAYLSKVSNSLFRPPIIS
ncbi:MAG: hypothetical protein K6L80_03235 [Agarilytica sp.]